MVRQRRFLTQTKAAMWQRSCERKSPKYAQFANAASEGRKNTGQRGIKMEPSKAKQGTINLVPVDRKGCTIHLSHPFSTLCMRSGSAISPSWKIIFRHVKYMRREVQSESQP